MYKAETISEYIIDKCANEGHPVTNFQLQLILYFIQINFMKLINVAAFDEDIEAWKNGPVIPEIYDKYDYCAGTPIYETYKDTANKIYRTPDKEIIDAVIESIRDGKADRPEQDNGLSADIKSTFKKSRCGICRHEQKIQSPAECNCGYFNHINHHNKQTERNTICILNIS